MKLVWTLWASQHPQLPSLPSVFLLPIRAHEPSQYGFHTHCRAQTADSGHISIPILLDVWSLYQPFSHHPSVTSVQLSWLHRYCILLVSVPSLVTSGRLLIHSCPSKPWCATSFCVWTPSLHIYSSSTPRWSDGRTCRCVKLSPLTHHNKSKGGTIL